MARRFFKEITAVLLLAVMCAPTARAKEEFVPYTEAREKMSVRPAERESISVDELRAAIEKGDAPLLFDARSKNEFEVDRLPGAQLPRTDDYYRELSLFQQNIIRTAPSSKQALEKKMAGMDRGTAIVTYCHNHCGLSKNLMLDLEALGFKNVRWLDGGIDVWREKGYPVEKK